MNFENIVVFKYCCLILWKYIFEYYKNTCQKYCGRNKSFHNQVLLFALGMDQGADATLMNLFNPTSGRGVSHPCLISTWPKEWCAIVCVMWASLKNCACMHYAPNCGRVGGEQYLIVEKFIPSTSVIVV